MLTIVSAVLFVHVASALAVFAALSLEAGSLFHLRKAVSAGEARLWIDASPRLPALAMGSLVLLLLSGIYLATQMSGWAIAWIRVSMATLFLIAPLGAATARRMRAIRRACGEDSPAGAALLTKLRDPFLPFSMNVRMALVLGIVLLMTAKPGLGESLTIVAAFAMLGAVASRISSKQGAAQSIASAESR